MTPSVAPDPINELKFHSSLTPKIYEILGTRFSSQLLFTDVNILDSTGREPYRGDVYIKGERILEVGTVSNKDKLLKDPEVRVFRGKGRTLMSGLGDAHAHFTWNGGDLGRLGELETEEHTLVTVKSARCFLDSGYTMAFGAASAKKRLDVVIRDAINAGAFPGPRYLANGQEVCKTNGELVAGISAIAKGEEELRNVIREHIALGVDNVKLSMSGEEITGTRPAEECYFTDKDTEVCVDEAHRFGKRVCAHARSRDAVKLCAEHGVDVVYHASFVDDEGMSMLEEKKTQLVVAPAINWLVATLTEAESFGYSQAQAEKAGYKRELDAAIAAMREMHRRGIVVLPGGDYGFAWTPHGTYARDLEHFVRLLGFTEHEALIAATSGIAKLFMRENELGKIFPGYYADCILIDGDPLEDITLLQNHDKINIIVINGRIYKAGLPRIGHYDLQKDTIQPLSFLSGTPVKDLYQVVEAGESHIKRSDEPIPASSVRLLAPIWSRDVLAVGKNYVEHAKEFNQSGYDSSDKIDQPSHPVIFTKRATSIVAHGDEIFSHPEFTESLDYEGELGVIIGKPGFRIDEDNAMDHVWGYTIVNDVTARERQRDHKQFFIGKSADTFCPMGPIAVAKEHLPEVLQVQTRVNGEIRQDSTTKDLIFSIPNLVKTISEGQTLQSGDVLATGTPAGVGIGRKPPVFLKPGDEVAISITGLGTLRNKVSDNTPSAPSFKNSAITVNNHKVSEGIIDVGGKLLHYKKSGSDTGRPIVFLHGLGGSIESWGPLISQGLFEDRPLHLFDLEGHGHSPTSPLSTLSIKSFSSDLLQVFKHANITGGATIIAHSMGCLIAETFAIDHPGLIESLVLLGPPPSPLPEAGSQGSLARAREVRAKGMLAVVDAVVSAGTSQHTQKSNYLGVSAIRLSLISQDPEGYAKACSALAGATEAINFKAIKAKTLIITGEEDKVSPPALCKNLGERIAGSQVVVLPRVGHWHVFEDPQGVSEPVTRFLSV
ncbi:uncharacterized protein K452DRAFT_353896 [Aplosporella prunicola CBS 121167]|uniref:Amidohydrolase-related domain-containing protein n=1 Tax=Aplosporella prunicola CBS 121167 TaxID=1176127 RepID=A0A6A6AX22_9PEZI|nr:uncharacterized protein K452DRAFT_353896 [Aplosporella prunicola CBS 121167]KAF2136479.1 hypothetical protein K452DRAFT_353896 [Aplosporella prunicola CBS 121167]